MLARSSLCVVETGCGRRCTRSHALYAAPPRRRPGSGEAGVRCCLVVPATPPPVHTRRRLFLVVAAAAGALACWPHVPLAHAAESVLAEATFEQIESFAKACLLSGRAAALVAELMRHPLLVCFPQASYEARQLDAALEALSELIRREPQVPVWRERRGQVFVDLKRFMEALQDFDAAVAAQPPGFVSLGLLANRALAHEGLSEWQAASDDYSRAIMLAQGVGFDAPYLLNGRGNARAALGDYEGALLDFQAASAVFQEIKNLSGTVYADSNAALMEAQLGRDELATKHMEAVARRAAGSIDMRAALAAQRWAVGDEVGAERDWNWACTNINSGILRPGGPALDGCALYRDDTWVRTIRRWPPRMAQRLADFLALRAPPT